MANHHFFADDWPLLAYANGFDAPIAVIEFARNLLRPVEGVFWVTELKLLGFDRSAVHFVSILLNAAACGVFAHALGQAFPTHPRLAPAAALTAFFLPMLSTTTYIMYTDNSRLSVLLYWVGVVACQTWARRPSGRVRLALGAVLFLASTLTYENTVLFLLVAPMFVVPVLSDRSSGTGPIGDGMASNPDRRRAIVALGSALTIVVLGFLAVRYVVLGGVHPIAYPMPSAAAFAKYGTFALDYVVLAAKYLPERPADWAMGATMAAATLWFLESRAKSDPTVATHRETQLFQSRFGVATLGAVMTVLGFAPYMLAFSPPVVANLEGAGRIYSSAAYGIALLLALVVTPRSQGLRRIGTVALAGYVGVNAAFAASLAPRWAEAAHINCRIWKSLLVQAPGIADGVTFLFVAAPIGHRGATVIAEPAGTRFLLPFLYGHRRWEDLAKVDGYHLEAFERDLPPTSDRRLTVKADGLMVRGRNPTQPIDPGRVILVRRDGERMVVLDRIAKDDNLIAANWLDGVSEVRTNRGAILAAPPNARPIEARLVELSIKCR